MSITIRQVGPCFAGEVSGLDMRIPLSREDAAAIHAGMDRYAILVFRDQKIDDTQQLAFTQALGDTEHSIRTRLPAHAAPRLPTHSPDLPDPTPTHHHTFAISKCILLHTHVHLLDLCH